MWSVYFSLILVFLDSIYLNSWQCGEGFETAFTPSCREVKYKQSVDDMTNLKNPNIKKRFWGALRGLRGE